MPIFRVGKPRISVSLSADIAMGVTTGEVGIPFDTVDYVEGDLELDTGNGEVFVPTAGYYSMLGILNRQAEAVSGRTIAVVHTSMGPQVVWRIANNNAAVATQVPFYWELEANTIVSFKIRDNGQVAHLNGGDEDTCRLQVVRLGPVRWT